MPRRKRKPTPADKRTKKQKTAPCHHQPPEIWRLIASFLTVRPFLLLASVSHAMLSALDHPSTQVSQEIWLNPLYPSMLPQLYRFGQRFRFFRFPSFRVKWSLSLNMGLVLRLPCAKVVIGAHRGHDRLTRSTKVMTLAPESRIREISLKSNYGDRTVLAGLPHFSCLEVLHAHEIIPPTAMTRFLQSSLKVLSMMYDDVQQLHGFFDTLTTSPCATSLESLSIMWFGLDDQRIWSDTWNRLALTHLRHFTFTGPDVELPSLPDRTLDSLTLELWRTKPHVRLGQNPRVHVRHLELKMRHVDRWLCDAGLTFDILTVPASAGGCCDWFKRFPFLQELKTVDKAQSVVGWGLTKKNKIQCILFSISVCMDIAGVAATLLRGSAEEYLHPSTSST